jgi:uncharacterized protein YecE (DUF72 family)
MIGTSGWQYTSWKLPYYGRTPQRQWYEKVLADFRTVELNVSFYRLPKLETFQGWARRAPSDAVVTVKASRYLTHIKRLRDPRDSVDLLMSRATGLADRLGPILVQLPPDMTVQAEALAETLDAFPPSVRLAVEPRHESWWTDEVRSVLTQRNAALVWADRKNHPMGPLWRTADWGYLRMHEGRGGTATPWPFYGRTALQTWAERLQETYGDDADAFVYFNNDPKCAAIDNAITFGQACDRIGLARTRTPAERPHLVEVA